MATFERHDKAPAVHLPGTYRLEVTRGGDEGFTARIIPANAPEPTDSVNVRKDPLLKLFWAGPARPSTYAVGRSSLSAIEISGKIYEIVNLEFWARAVSQAVKICVASSDTDIVELIAAVREFVESGPIPEPGTKRTCWLQVNDLRTAYRLYLEFELATYYNTGTGYSIHGMLDYLIDWWRHEVTMAGASLKPSAELIRTVGPEHIAALTAYRDQWH